MREEYDFTNAKRTDQVPALARAQAAETRVLSAAVELVLARSERRGLRRSTESDLVLPERQLANTPATIDPPIPSSTVFTKPRSTGPG